ncbi:hypothetical protein [Streptomyces sp. NPDC059861]
MDGYESVLRDRVTDRALAPTGTVTAARTRTDTTPQQFRSTRLS